jgi:hypothetical protein
VSVEERDADGEETGERRVLFRTVFVFDVSQIEVLPGREPVALEPPRQSFTGDSHAHLVESLSHEVVGRQGCGHGPRVVGRPEVALLRQTGSTAAPVARRRRARGEGKGPRSGGHEGSPQRGDSRGLLSCLAETGGGGLEVLEPGQAQRAPAVEPRPIDAEAFGGGSALCPQFLQSRLAVAHGRCRRRWRLR